jgi:hypothetical protein
MESGANGNSTKHGIQSGVRARTPEVDLRGCYSNLRRKLEDLLDR